MRLALALLACAVSAPAAGLPVAAVETTAAASVRVRISCNHGWRNQRNRDAGWVFLN